jgi:multicomponent Na+:H+ antiporter subunit B
MTNYLKTDLIDTISRKLGPYVLLFGCYMISHGHMSPGGGFQGGVVLASGGMLILLGCQEARLEGHLPVLSLSIAELAGYLAFLLLGLSGIIFAGYFLASPFQPELVEGGIAPVPWFVYMLNMVIGVKVGAGVGLICITLLQNG